MNRYQKKYIRSLMRHMEAEKNVRECLAANKAYQAANKIAYGQNPSEKEEEEAMNTVCAIEAEVEKNYNKRPADSRLLAAQRKMLQTFIRRIKKRFDCPAEIKEYFVPEKLKKILMYSKKNTQTLIDIAMKDRSWK